MPCRSGEKRGSSDPVSILLILKVFYVCQSHIAIRILKTPGTGWITRHRSFLSFPCIRIVWKYILNHRIKLVHIIRKRAALLLLLGV